MADEIDYTLIRAAREALSEGNSHAALAHLDAFITNTPKVEEKSEADKISDAERVLRADYHNDVDLAAESVADQWRSGHFDGMESAIDDAIDEECQGHSRVTRDDEALLCLLFSNNDKAYQDVTEELTDWTTAAYYAFKQDVREELANKVDLDQSPPNEGDKLCPECDTYQPGDEFDLTKCADCSREAGNERCDECETWNIAEEITDGKCEDCREVKP